jgi:hypothetical protein
MENVYTDAFSPCCTAWLQLLIYLFLTLQLILLSYFERKTAHFSHVMHSGCTFAAASALRGVSYPRARAARSGADRNLFGAGDHKICRRSCQENYTQNNKTTRASARHHCRT